MKHLTWSPALRDCDLFFTFVIPASCLFIILSFPAKKKVIVFFGCFSTIINFLVGSHLACACHGAVLGSEIRSAQHTCLPAASANARLVLKYFSSTKGRVPDAACSHCNVLVLYRTCIILYDTSLMDVGCIFDRIWFWKFVLNLSLVMQWEDMVANYN